MKAITTIALVAVIAGTVQSRLIGGGDCIDDNDCNACAGYTWDNITEACIRVWENTQYVVDELEL